MTQPSAATFAAAVATGADGVLERSVIIPVRDEAGNELRLVGTLTFPSDLSEAPPMGVITVHGWGGNRAGPHRIFVRLGRALAARGVPTLRFDLSGRGESDGVAAATTLDDMIRDAFAARAFLQDELHCAEVNICGMCSGGNVAIGLATLTATARLSLISTLPFSARGWRVGMRKTFHYLKGYANKAARLDTWRRLLRGEINTGGVAKTLTASARESADERRLKDSARDIMHGFGRVRSACQFIYGGADPEGKSARTHYETFCQTHNIAAEFQLVENANHNYYARTWSAAVEAAAVRFLTDDAGYGTAEKITPSTVS